MGALRIREAIITEIDELSDEQAIAVLEFIQSVKDDSSIAENDEDDPLVGFVSGPTDLAEHTEAILKSEFGVPKSEDEDSA